ncbi:MULTISPECIES: SDR family NAD(P)-dependent oxidoreductase [Thalassobaculum]|uniref:NAD(P)-dependent dehydrogenase, short-chain alcohol dehydrogenase family n=1 Tax=Thalassobaculum litoreum DSM 18839 TaxID=1123362 RepID=A0A8G2EZA4_9PROT|nr:MULTISPECIES: SDR family oxidoreductase [Thalassobaculum]SDG15283.1 NAD(P)-dependent dehydrogenase, short-chain alcohol dehydrogenase family [Thalassobaculum litoreum DSM 18839]
MSTGSAPASRSVLVTGGTSGIGLAIARGFAAAGQSVTGAGLGTLPEPEANLSFRTLDVTDTAAIADLAAGHDRLDVLVNAAGVIRRGEELEPEVFAQVIDINLNGTMRMCAAMRPTLASAKGCIINIASMLSYFGGGLVPGYSASKGGVAQLTKSLAIAYAADGIRVNALAPGWIATPLTVNLRADETRNAAITGRTPMGRWGQPEELAGPALFLASDAASFITGTILNVDGGYAAM